MALRTQPAPGAVRFRAFSTANPDAAALVEEPGARRVHFLRHGDALHKERAAAESAKGKVCRCHDTPPTTDGCPYLDPALMDAALTPAGHAQVRGIAAACGARVVLVSPAVRALETAVDAFAGADLPTIVALEDLRSRVSAHQHTRRHTITELRARFPAADFSACAVDEDRLWTGAAEPRAAVDARVRGFLRALSARGERDVAVVTHFTMFLALLNRASDPLVLGVDPDRADDRAWLDCSGCPVASRLTRLLGPGELRSLVLVPTM